MYGSFVGSRFPPLFAADASRGAGAVVCFCPLPSVSLRPETLEPGMALCGKSRLTILCGHLPRGQTCIAFVPVLPDYLPKSCFLHEPPNRTGGPSRARVIHERGAGVKYAGPKHGTRDICRASAPKLQGMGWGLSGAMGIRHRIGFRDNLLCIARGNQGNSGVYAPRLGHSPAGCIPTGNQSSVSLDLNGNGGGGGETTYSFP